MLTSDQHQADSATDLNHNELPIFLRQLKSFIQDDKVWQAQLFDLLNNHTYNQCEVDLFELMCSVIERSLFAQVDWARNSVFFRDLKVSFSALLVIFVVHFFIYIISSKILSAFPLIFCINDWRYFNRYCNFYLLSS